VGKPKGRRGERERKRGKTFEVQARPTGALARVSGVSSFDDPPSSIDRTYNL
jgi:hypothetical protein